MQFRKLLTLLAILALQSLALCQDVSVRDVVRKYLAARNAGMQLNAPPQDIEKTLDLCSENIVLRRP